MRSTIWKIVAFAGAWKTRKRGVGERPRMIGRGPDNGKATHMLIAGNWKMNGQSAALAEIEALVGAFKARPPAVDVLVCPPATLISRVAAKAEGAFSVGGQDCHPKASGVLGLPGLEAD